MTREPMLVMLEEKGLGPEQAVAEYERLLVQTGHLMLLTVPMAHEDKLSLYAVLTCEGRLSEEALGTIQRVAKKWLGPCLARGTRAHWRDVLTLAGLDKLSNLLLSRLEDRGKH